eukprot:GHVH01007928.1.p1 GENE.GHVH01007928.1~~GHVH01007928.1.p1  ORF type:complete len:234 (+),score=14.45 GHVH01007928.1:298-999(+)
MLLISIPLLIVGFPLLWSVVDFLAQIPFLSVESSTLSCFLFLLCLLISFQGIHSYFVVLYTSKCTSDQCEIDQDLGVSFVPSFLSLVLVCTVVHQLCQNLEPSWSPNFILTFTTGTSIVLAFQYLLWILRVHRINQWYKSISQHSLSQQIKSEQRYTKKICLEWLLLSAIVGVLRWVPVCNNRFEIDDPSFFKVLTTIIRARFPYVLIGAIAAVRIAHLFTKIRTINDLSVSF